MDWSASELFVEILVAGVLFVFAISPVLIRISRTANSHPGIAPGFNTWAAWKPWIFLAIAVVYTIGIAGNRITEQICSVSGCDLSDDLRKFEWNLRIHSETARDWVERHRTYIKVLRAAAFSSFIFLVSMFIHDRTDPSVKRYDRKSYYGAVIFLLFSGIAFHLEITHYSDNLTKHRSYVENAEKCSDKMGYVNR